MDKQIRLLGILLVGQLALAVALFSTGADLQAVRPDTPLLEFATTDIHRVVIQGGREGEEVVLVKGEAGWQLPDHFGFPADSDKVEALLSRLAALRHGLPVATTASALQRFKVSEDAFERRIILHQGEGVAGTLYFGTSPGLRRIHARGDGDDGVFSVKMALHDAPFEAERWENKRILTFPEEEVTGLELSGLTLTRDPESDVVVDSDVEGGEENSDLTPPWQVVGLEGGETLRADQVDTLVRKLANLSIDRVLGLEAKAAYGLDAPALTLSITRRGQGESHYQVSGPLEGSFHVVKTSNRPEYFRIPQYAGETLLENAARNQLVASPVGEESPSEGNETVTEGMEAAPAVAMDALLPE
ncbi:MAG: DUF4340 domain-containing protein [Magnetococcales bacterium]|nr:DUF4340 domain-containing protein [Magnetococcales bacterium]